MWYYRVPAPPQMAEAIRRQRLGLPPLETPRRRLRLVSFNPEVPMKTIEQLRAAAEGVVAGLTLLQRVQFHLMRAIAELALIVVVLLLGAMSWAFLLGADLGHWP